MKTTLAPYIKNGNLYGYKLSDGGLGIVFAGTLDDAKNKVKQAYVAHGLPDYDFSDMEVWNIKNAPFDDAPDVLEIYEY